MRLRMLCLALLVPCVAGADDLFSPPLFSSEPPLPGDAALSEYVRHETMRLTETCPAGLPTETDWQVQREEWVRQYQEMLGLESRLGEGAEAARPPLHPVVTGRLEQDEFVVENLHFQASPGLYCTANLYLPRDRAEPVPAILYACGHGRHVVDGISYGNKAVYQVDGAWFARNGYVCLVLDTLLAGEIQGVHTGTRDQDLWWWNAAGYTPAGVEAWFGIRALDYLSTRPEVDPDRFGITGHSGGGAYSWAVTALDDRIKVAAPLAGITDLQRHLLDNLMDRHCDCNFPINVYGWDFAQLAVLAAPRPLLIGATDRDPIFPLAGTMAIYEKVQQVYRACGELENLGLVIAPGGHDETAELRLAVMRWFDHHLKGVEPGLDPPVVVEAKRFFEPQQLRVFDGLPEDAVNADIAETFVARAPPANRSAAELRTRLRSTVFAGWPGQGGPLETVPAFRAEADGLRLCAWDFRSQPGVVLRLYLLQAAGGGDPGNLDLRVIDGDGWRQWLAGVQGAFADDLADELALAGPVPADADRLEVWKQDLTAAPVTLAFFAPRGVGLTAWSGDAKRLRRARRRFLPLGQTLDGMRVWDIRRAIEALQAIRSIPPHGITLRAHGDMGVNTLYAALFEPSAIHLALSGLPTSHREGPDYLGILKVTDIPEVQAALIPPLPQAIPGPIRWGRAVLRQSRAWYASAEARAIADSVLAYQSPQGGWPKSTNLSIPPRTPEEIPAPGGGRANSLDNDATTVPMAFLAKVVQASDDPNYAESFLRGLEYLLEAQYPDGGWPQFYPIRDGYYSHITFNDDAMINVMNLLRGVATNQPEYDFVDRERRARAGAAVTRGVACILQTQIRESGRRTAWCAQHDKTTNEAAWARAYEPPSLSGAESVGIVRFLMTLDDPTPDVIASVEGAVAWLRRVAIRGWRVEWYTDPEGRKDRRLVRDADAPLLWARFYELGSHRPLYLDRDSVFRFDFAELSHERRTGYEYLGHWPATLLSHEYPEWRAKHDLP